MRPRSHPPALTHARRYRSRRRCAYTAPARVRIALAETDRWQRLEEREFGRLAQEADHLFDTSLTFYSGGQDH